MHAFAHVAVDTASIPSPVEVCHLPLASECNFTLKYAERTSKLDIVFAVT